MLLQSSADCSSDGTPPCGAAIFRSQKRARRGCRVSAVLADCSSADRLEGPPGWWQKLHDSDTPEIKFSESRFAQGELLTSFVDTVEFLAMLQNE